MQKRIEIQRMARDFGVLVGAHPGILLLLGMIIIMTLSIISVVIFACTKKSSKNDRGARTKKAMTEKVVVRVDTKTKEAKMSQQHLVPRSNVPPPVLPDHSHKHHRHCDNSHHHHHHHHYHHASSHNHHHHMSNIHHHVSMHVHHPTVIL